MQRRYIAGLAAVALVCASAPARAQQTQRTHHIRSYTNTLQLGVQRGAFGGDPPIVFAQLDLYVLKGHAP